MTRKNSVGDDIPRLGFPLVFAKEQTRQVDVLRQITKAVDKNCFIKNPINASSIVCSVPGKESTGDDSVNSGDSNVSRRTAHRKRSQTNPVIIKVWGNNSHSGKLEQIEEEVRFGRERSKTFSSSNALRSTSLSPRLLEKRGHESFPWKSRESENGNLLSPDACFHRSVDELIHSDYYLPKKATSLNGARRRSVCTTDHKRLLQLVNKDGNHPTSLSQDGGINLQSLSPAPSFEHVNNTHTSSCTIHSRCGLVTTFVEDDSDWSSRARQNGSLVTKQRTFDTPLARFKHAAKLVMLLLRCTDSASVQVAHQCTLARQLAIFQRESPNTCQRREAGHSEAKLLSFAQLQSELTSPQQSVKADLAFDLSLFRANKKMQLSHEAMLILQKNPSERTEAELHTALVALNQVVEAFGEFPINMQESLVKVGWYEKFAAKRVIIRQGHKADNFYFILSGVAVVTILETDNKTGELYVRTAAFLKKGNSFGELALMHGALRSATVTCQDDVELLAVGREDFIDIFMPVTKDTEPDHIVFLRSVDILDLWPLSCLPYDDPKICLFTYFRRGVVMCKDSNRSEWIYVIKTGSCRVLKSLKAAKTAIPDTTKNAYLPNLGQDGLVSPRGKSKSTSSLNLTGSQQSLNKGHGLPTQTMQRKRYQFKLSQSLPPIRKRKQKDFIESAEQHLKTIEAVYGRLHPSNQSSIEQDNKSEDNKSVQTETVFVQVQKLISKDTFGLVHVAFEMTGNSTSVSLVSDGAECILINKKFFLQHLTDVMKKQLRKQIQPYPTEESLQRKLQEKADWDAYKVRTVKDFIHSSKLHDTLYY